MQIGTKIGTNTISVNCETAYKSMVFLLKGHHITHILNLQRLIFFEIDIWDYSMDNSNYSWIKDDKSYKLDNWESDVNYILKYQNMLPFFGK